MDANLKSPKPVSKEDDGLLVVHEPLDILQQLIAIPSVNPMGVDVSGSEYYEHGVTHWLVEFFRQLEVPYEIQEVSSGRCNVVAKFETTPAAPTILFDAHQDTVPVDGMTISPFAPVIQEGRVYGRGACDVKGGMAAMLAAFSKLVRERRTDCANVVMACTCDEEYTAMGARYLARHWSPGGSSESVAATRPDFCVVAEPTDLNVVVAHRGVLRWKIVTHGIACHSSRPREGHNAIYDMAQVVFLLQQYADQLMTEIPAHPLCGGPTLSVGKISGGTSVNIVPHQCEIEIDRRTIPGESSGAALQDIEDFLRQRTSVSFEMLPPWIVADSLSDDNNRYLAEKLLEQIASIVGPREKLGAFYCTNASCFAVIGNVPSVVFGPGSIDQAHTKEEWLEVAQLQQASDIYYQLCINARDMR